MPNKTVILTILAAALAFGTIISGCNRDNRTAMKPQRSSRGPSTRPAEVLAASAYRPPARHVSEPVMMAQAPARSTRPTAYVSQVYTLPPGQAPGSVASDPYVLHPSPELAMARAYVPQYQTAPAVYNPAPPPVAYVPAPAPAAMRRAPIPELEPMRYQRLPSTRTNTRPVAEILMSAGSAQADRQEIQRALAPLSQPVQHDPRQGWVASPTTAMRAYY